MITGDFIAARHEVKIEPPGPAEMF
jgi:hypothetical protein